MSRSFDQRPSSLARPLLRLFFTVQACSIVFGDSSVSSTFTPRITPLSMPTWCTIRSAKLRRSARTGLPEVSFQSSSACANSTGVRGSRSPPSSSLMASCCSKRSSPASSGDVTAHQLVERGAQLVGERPDVRARHRGATDVPGRQVLHRLERDLLGARHRRGGKVDPRRRRRRRHLRHRLRGVDGELAHLRRWRRRRRAADRSSVAPQQRGEGRIVDQHRVPANEHRRRRAPFRRRHRLELVDDELVERLRRLVIPLVGAGDGVGVAAVIGRAGERSAARRGSAWPGTPCPYRRERRTRWWRADRARAAPSRCRRSWPRPSAPAEAARTPR